MSKVLVGMSGGVDSAVAATLLKEQGYDVIGVTLKLWDSPEHAQKTGKTCCSLDDVEDARGVAFSLDIPFYVLNMKQIFEEKVIDYFVDSYLQGRTPNPCIACNRYLKFDAMLEKAKALGAEFIATGHYVRTMRDPETGRTLLLKAVDPRKDQSYVLYMLTQEQLSHTLFPLGGLTKDRVREIAGNRSAHVSNKPDSQDICFVPDGDYAAFIRNRTGTGSKPGRFVTTKGTVLGAHRGVASYTVGQRKGLGLALPEPHYVVNKDMATGDVILGTQSERFRRSLVASGMNWILFEKPPECLRAEAKIRYSANAAPATVRPLPDARMELTFDEPQPDIAPGQTVVLYDGEIVIGGGVIETSADGTVDV